MDLNKSFLARLRQLGDLTTQDQVQITLPRISFEIQGINYDPTRKVSPTQYIRTYIRHQREQRIHACSLQY